MKALTIHQPWASLIACGAKVYETRSWKTNYRGRIAIHAGKKSAYSVIDKMFPNTGEQTADEINFVYAVRERLGDEFEEDIPYGAVIATAELVDCKFITEQMIVSKLEKLFGDFTPGRFAWELRDIQVLAKPVPARGRQGLWEWRPPFDPALGSGRIAIPERNDLYVF